MIQPHTSSSSSSSSYKLAFEEFLEALLHCAVLLHAAAADGARHDYARLVDGADGGRGAEDHSQTAASAAADAADARERHWHWRQQRRRRRYKERQQRSGNGSSNSDDNGNGNGKENTGGRLTNDAAAKGRGAFDDGIRDAVSDSDDGSVWSLDSYTAGATFSGSGAGGSATSSVPPLGLIKPQQHQPQPEQEQEEEQHPHMDHFEGLGIAPGGAGSRRGEMRGSLASRQFEALLDRMAAMVPSTVPRIINHGHDRVHWAGAHSIDGSHSGCGDGSTSFGSSSSGLSSYGPCGGSRALPSDVRMPWIKQRKTQSLVILDTVRLLTLPLFLFRRTTNRNNHDNNNHQGRRLIKGTKRLLELTQQLRRERTERAAAEEAAEYERRAQRQAAEMAALAAERTPVLALAAERLNRRHIQLQLSQQREMRPVPSFYFSSSSSLSTSSATAAAVAPSSVNRLGPVNLGHPAWVGGFRSTLSLPRQSPRKGRAVQAMIVPAPSAPMPFDFKDATDNAGALSAAASSSSSSSSSSSVVATTSPPLAHVTNVPHLHWHECAEMGSTYFDSAGFGVPFRDEPVCRLGASPGREHTRREAF